MAVSLYPAKSKYSFTAQFRSLFSASFSGPRDERVISRFAFSPAGPSDNGTSKGGPTFFPYHSIPQIVLSHCMSTSHGQVRYYCCTGILGSGTELVIKSAD